MSSRRPNGRSRCPVAASPGVFARHGAAIARHVRGGSGGQASVCASSTVLGRLHDERRSPRLPSPSAMLPPLRKRHEPMLRKGNVLVCVDTRSSTRRARRLAEVRVSGPGPARYSANGERANLLHSGGGLTVPRPFSIVGAVPMEPAQDHRTRACVHKMFQEAEAKRVVRPDGSGIRFPRSTSS